jgi:hypothetical protein
LYSSLSSDEDVDGSNWNADGFFAILDRFKIDVAQPSIEDTYWGLFASLVSLLFTFPLFSFLTVVRLVKR